MKNDYDEELLAYAIEKRRSLHEIPELGLNLPKTFEFVKKELESLGIEYKSYDDISCLVGLIKGKGDGKVIGLRADMDGLPIKEETGLSFASKNGNMHACGHDGHTASLLAAAKYLSENRDKFKGSIKLLFQAGEEYPGGARPMIERGALENPKVDAVIGMHQGIINPILKKGKIGICYGPIMASMDRFSIKVIGKGAHGAYPQNSVDAISIACEIVGALNKIVSREIKATDPAVLSVCRIEGGFNQNILPNEVELEGTVRAVNEEVRAKIARRIEEIAKGIGSAYGAKIECTYDFKYPPLINDKEFTGFFEGVLRNNFKDEEIEVLDKPIMGGEDMAFFLKERKGTFFFLSNPKDGEGPRSHHRPDFDIDEKLMIKGIKILIETCKEFLK